MMKGLPTQRVWVIRAGKLARAHNLFLNENIVALERQNVGNLKELPTARKAFTEKLRALAVLGGNTSPSLRHIAGRFYTFIHEIRDGDIVVYPATSVDGQVWIGQILKPYCYQDKPNQDFPHQRNVTWIKHFSRLDLKPDVLSEINAFYPLFEVRRNPQVFLKKSLC